MSPSPPLFDLSSFSLGNALEGTLPAFVPGITYVDLRDNHISGSIPPNFPSGVTWLGLSNNKLSGGLSAQVTVNMEVLYLDNNNMSGPLTVTAFQSLRSIRIENNRFTGDFPFLTSAYLVEAANNRYPSTPKF